MNKITEYSLWEVLEQITSSLKSKRLADVFRFTSFCPFETYGPHKHMRIEINYIKKGNCILHLDNESISFHEGDIMIITPHVEHQFEAGKGFAVVADEIRQLSEQTKDASANITEIIQKLNEDTKRANDSIMTAAESVEKQNQLIDDTRDKFNDVGNAVEVLMGNIDVAEQSIQKILDATGVISDNITHLSATGEEVAASSTEGLRTADITVEKMSNCKKVLENIYLLAEDLKNSVENNENQ